MIKIIHLITGLGQGGAEMMLYKLVSGMDRSCFENVVISLGDKGVYGELFEKAGIKLFTLDMKRTALPLVGLTQLVAILNQEKPDVLQTWLYHADFMGSIAGKLARVPKIVWNIRCSDMDLSKYSRGTQIILKLLRPLSRIPNSIIVNSSAGKLYHEKLGYRSQWKLIPNGFDTRKFCPNPLSKIKIKKLLNIPESSLIIGTVARYDPMKDFPNLLSAADLLAKEIQGVHFILIGKGIDSSNRGLTEFLRERRLIDFFHLLGAQSDIAHFVQSFDLFTLTSAFGEGFPNVIGEAMSCGIPCVATDVGDSAAIVGDTGVIVPPKDPASLAEAWFSLIKAGKEKLQDLGIKARQRIIDHFSIEKIIHQYEAFYKSTLNPNQVSLCAES